MTAQTRVSAKGQVVIPKEVRKRHQLTPGRVLDVIDTPEGVLLRPRSTRQGISLEEAIARIGAVVRYDGPPVTVEEMNETIRRMGARGGPENW